MHINGYEFLELNPANLINTDKGVKVRIFGSAEGWEVQVGSAVQGTLVVTPYNTFGEACQAASEAVAALPDDCPEFSDYIDGKWYESGSTEAEEAEGAAAIREYVTQRSQYQPRVVGRISGESWGRGDY